MPLLALSGAALTACGVLSVSSQAERIDERTYRIESPRVAGGVTGPNIRTAEKLCPNGYRVIDQSRDTDNYQGGVTITWTVRCL
jgi:hypothetical protein